MTRSDLKTSHDRPYRAEYARSGGSVCRQCHNHIGQESLRLAFMAEAATRDDARVPQWFHFNCFWKKNRPGKLSDFEGWKDLREGDQALLEEHIHGLHGGTTSEEEDEVEREEERRTERRTEPPKRREVSPPTQKERDEQTRPHTHEAGLKTFSVSYARSGSSRCRACDQNIRQGDIRIGKRDANTHDALVYGPRVQYHHVRCFRDNRYLLDFDDEASIEDVPGFDKLHDNDKRRLAHMLGGGQKHEQPEGGRDSGLGTEHKQPGEMVEEKGQKQRTTTSFRPHVAADFKGGSIEAMSPPEQENVDEAIEEEEEAYRGRHAFVEGQLAEGPPMETRAKTLEKREQGIIQEEEEAMEEGERGAESRTRVTSGTYQPPSLLESGERPLANLRFFITGRMQRRSLQEVRDDLERLGATIVPEPDESVVAAVVSDYKARIGAQSTHVRAAMKANVHVVGEDFVDDVVAAAKAGRLVADPASYREAKNSRSMIWLADLVNRDALVANCGSDVAARIRRSLAAAHELSGGRHLGKSTSVNLEQLPGTGGDEKRLKVTPKLSVDHDSGLEDDAHVFTEKDENEKNKCVWSVLLHSVPETSLSNFYYRIQMLESNDNDMWWVYRSWGRVGTAIGSNKLDVFEDQGAAKRNFEQVFEEKTGLAWNNGQFSGDERITGRYFPIDEADEEESQEKEGKQEKHEGEEKMAID